MDEQGFIFTTDAILALVVMIVFTASVVTYGLLPVYQGENHQHLEGIADSALDAMDQSGALREATVEYATGNVSGAQATLSNSLQTVLPNNVGYNLTLGTYGAVSNSNGIYLPTDVITKVKVISGPQQGWMGRAYYKQDQVLFQTINSTSVTTIWNFHNYLSNFDPWSGGLNTYPYWGGTNPTGRTPPPQTSVPITFYVPGTPNSAVFLIGAAAGSGQTKLFNPDVVINTINQNNILNSSFIFTYNSASQGPISNYQQNLCATQLNNGYNTFYVQFKNATATDNLPWFNIIANYTTPISVPVGVANITVPFANVAGIGNPTKDVIYNFDNGGTVTNTTSRTETWADLQSNFNYDISTPFVLTGLPVIGTGSAVASEQDINIPLGSRLFDAVTVVNAFGGEDGCVVQVEDPTGLISTAFSSWGNTARTDGGYGNVPGTINIAPYLKVGDNKVRIITWDDVSSSDYDLAGLEDCYSKILYSQFPIQWATFPFNSYQNTSSNPTTTETQIEPFQINSTAQSALLFIGVGTATRNITVTVKNPSTGTSSVLYPATQPVPYVIDLGALDAAATQSKHVMTSIVGNGSSLIPGNYTLTVSVSPSVAYESGDGASNPPTYGNLGDPIIFSGTRISVIYPQFLQNVWETAYESTPGAAEDAANYNLQLALLPYFGNISTSQFKDSVVYTGNVPQAIPVRLDLWTQ
jgi:hypothetical protein